MKACNNSQKGFLVIDNLVIILAFLVFGALICQSPIGSGNFYCTESGVLKEIRLSSPDVSEISKIDRRFFDCTYVYAKTNSGAVQTYCLDSDVLFRYKLTKTSP